MTAGVGRDNRPMSWIPLPLLRARSVLAGLCAAAVLPCAAQQSPPPQPVPLTAVKAERPFSAPAPLAEVLRYKMQSPLVRELQIRLRHAKFLAQYDAHERFDGRTREALRKFQQDKGLPVTGELDQASWNALRTVSHQPTAAELNNTDVGPWFTNPGQRGFVLELQHRLRQAGHYSGPLDGQLSGATKAAVAALRQSLGLPASEVIDERTWAQLLKKTRGPRYAQLFAAPPVSDSTQILDPRCQQGKVVCISRAQKKMSLVQDGRILFTRAARFARPGWESPEGEYRIWYMNRDQISTIFGERTPMPYAIFYDGNVAIHFSDDFDLLGYASGSHGCSQLRDYQVAMWLYEQVKVGDKVVVY